MFTAEQPLCRQLNFRHLRVTEQTEKKGYILVNILLLLLGIITKVAINQQKLHI